MAHTASFCALYSPWWEEDKHEISSRDKQRERYPVASYQYLHRTMIQGEHPLPLTDQRGNLWCYMHVFWSPFDTQWIVRLNKFGLFFFADCWFTLIMMSITPGISPASTTHWIWWGCPAVMFEMVQAASCEEKQRETSHENTHKNFIGTLCSLNALLSPKVKLLDVYMHR